MGYAKMRFPSHWLGPAPALLISVMKHLGSAPKGAASWLPHSTPVRLPQRGREGLGDPSHPLAHCGPHGSAVWKRHDAEAEAPVGPQAREASMPPTPPHLSFLWSRGGGTLGQPPPPQPSAWLGV